jgi:hypothetical protein
MLSENRHLRTKKDGYFSKENCARQFDLHCIQQHVSPLLQVVPATAASSTSLQNGSVAGTAPSATVRRNTTALLSKSQSVRFVSSSSSSSDATAEKKPPLRTQRWNTRTLPSNCARRKVAEDVKEEEEEECVGGLHQLQRPPHVFVSQSFPMEKV